MPVLCLGKGLKDSMRGRWFNKTLLNHQRKFNIKVPRVIPMDMIRLDMYIDGK